jgi:hypothetical protein
MPAKKPRLKRLSVAKHTAGLLEDLQSKYTAIMEALQPLLVLPGKMDKLEANQEKMQNTLNAVVITTKELNRKMDATMEETAALRVGVTDIKQTVTVHDQKIKTLH